MEYFKEIWEIKMKKASNPDSHAMLPAQAVVVNGLDNGIARSYIDMFFECKLYEHLVEFTLKMNLWSRFLRNTRHTPSCIHLKCTIS